MISALVPFLFLLGQWGMGPGPGVGVGPTTPTLRGTNCVFNGGGAGTTVPFPAGTVVGDYTVATAAGGLNPGGPTTSGWTVVESAHSTTPWWSGKAYGKALDSSDIALGYVKIGFSGGDFDNVVCAVVFVGNRTATAAVSSQNGSPTGTSVVLSSGFSVASNAFMIYEGSARSATTNTISAGTLRQQGNNGGNASVALYTETGVTGVLSRTFSYSAGGNGNWQLIVEVH